MERPPTGSRVRPTLTTISTIGPKQFPPYEENLLHVYLLRFLCVFFLHFRCLAVAEWMKRWWQACSLPTPSPSTLRMSTSEWKDPESWSSNPDTTGETERKQMSSPRNKLHLYLQFLTLLTAGIVFAFGSVSLMNTVKTRRLTKYF